MKRVDNQNLIVAAEAGNTIIWDIKNERKVGIDNGKSFTRV